MPLIVSDNHIGDNTMSTTFQFLRLDGFRRGPQSKRGTVGSIIAEGLRQPSHISHLPGKPSYEVVHLDSPVADPSLLGVWIEEEMEAARNLVRRKGIEHQYRVKSTALAIGTVIASLPETLEDYDPVRFQNFAKDTTDWARDFLAPRDYLLHYRLEHLDELHPHIHLWFTPKPNNTRSGNWSFENLFQRKKGFLHETQKQYFSEVGYKYFDERAKPFIERNQRIPRYMAVKNRSESEIDLVKQFTAGEGPFSRTELPLNVVNSLLDKLSDDSIDSLPAIKRRLVTKEDEVTRTNQALVDLKLENDHLKVMLSKLRQQSEERDTQSGVELSQEVNASRELHTIKTSANQFFQEVFYPQLIDAVFSSAYRNLNRASFINRIDWEQLVIEDALPDLERLSKSADVVGNTQAWLNAAKEALNKFGILQETNPTICVYPEVQVGYEIASDRSTESDTPSAMRGRFSTSPASSEGRSNPWEEIKR